MTVLCLADKRAPQRRKGSSTVATRHDAIPRLRCSRRRNHDQADVDGFDELRTALSLATQPGPADWRTAARGDAATVTHLGISALAGAPPPAWAVDIAASALPLRAADGTVAARLLPKCRRRRFMEPGAPSRHEEA